MNAAERFRSWAPYFLGIQRIIAGWLFVLHGGQKLLGWFGGVPPEAPKWIIWTAGPIELIGGALLLIGLFTRSTAFLCSGLMAAAYFKGHAPGGFWPNMNGGEIAVLFCFMFLYIAAAGPGAWAVDNLLHKRRA